MVSFVVTSRKVQINPPFLGILAEIIWICRGNARKKGVPFAFFRRIINSANNISKFYLNDIGNISLAHNREGIDTMLELTVTTGMELMIGEDVKIVFKGSNAPGRMRIGVDAPKEKRIERVTALVKKQEPKIVIVNGHGQKN